MSPPFDLLGDLLDRVRETVHEVIDGLAMEQLVRRVPSEANSIAWLVWHLSRIQDDHVAAAAGWDQVWVAQGWVDRFGLPFDPSATGFGHSSDEVAAVQVRAELLAGYHDAVHRQTIRYLGGLRDGDLERVVDDSWDPPVTLGVRLVSVVSDDLQHAGQAAFVRGVLGA